MLSLSAILDLPKGWTVHPRHYDLNIDGVLYRHGDEGPQQPDQRCVPQCPERVHLAGAVTSTLKLALCMVPTSVIVTSAFRLDAEQIPDPYMAYSNVYAGRPLLGCIVLDGEYAAFEPLLLENIR